MRPLTSLIGRWAATAGILAATAAPVLAQDADQKTPYVARVVRDEVTVRAQASAAHERIGTLHRGDEVTVRRVVREWIQIDVPSSFPVWLHGKYLKRDGDQATVIGDRLNIRPTPDTSGSVLGQVSRGDQLRVVSAEGEWLQVLPPVSARAWVLQAVTEYVKPGADAKRDPKPLPIGTETPKPSTGPDVATRAREAFDRASKGTLGARDWSEVKALLEKAKAGNGWSEAAAAVERVVKIEEARDAQYKIELGDAQRRLEEENAALEALLDQIRRQVAEIGTQKPEVPFTAIGTFDALGMVWDRPGSHEIQNEKGVRFYLKSTSVNLRKAGWYGKKVGVRGQVVELPGWGRVIEVHEIALLEPRKAKSE